MSIEKEIKQRLEQNLDVHHFEIKDFTGRHLTHELHEGGFHLEAVIVSDSFDGLSLIDRHNEIHALSMKTHTKSEWDNP